MSQVYSSQEQRLKPILQRDKRDISVIQGMFIQGFMASPCLFAFLFLTLPQSSSELRGKSVLFTQVLSSLISACLQEFSSSSPLEELWWDKGFQGGYFQCLSLCVCTRLYLSSHPWNWGKFVFYIFPLNSAFLLAHCYDALGSDSLGIISTVTVKWLLGDIHIFSVTGLPVLQFKMKHVVTRKKRPE